MYKNLGVANGWKEKPQELIKCEEQKHYLQGFVKERSTWSCYHHVTCEKCKIKWEYDSSG